MTAFLAQMSLLNAAHCVSPSASSLAPKIFRAGSGQNGSAVRFSLGERGGCLMFDEPVRKHFLPLNGAPGA